MGSPEKYKDNNYAVKKLMDVDQTPVIHHKVRNFDHKFDEMWEDTMHGYHVNPVDLDQFNITGDLSSGNNLSGSVHQRTSSDLRSRSSAG